MHRDDLRAALRLVQHGASSAFHGCVVTGNDRVAKLSVVGVGMRSHAGVATQLFETLANAGRAAALVSTSEIKISVLVPEDRAGKLCHQCCIEASGSTRLSRPEVLTHFWRQSDSGFL